MTDVSHNPHRPGRLRRRSRWLIGLCLAVPCLAPATGALEALPIAGTIFDQTGGPLEDVEVTLHPVPPVRETMALRLVGRTHPEAVMETTTGPDGRFRIDAPAPGFWTVVVRAEGVLPLEHPLGPLLGPPGDAPAAALELAPVRLLAAESLEVRVVDGEGGEVEGAVVEVSSSVEGEGGERRFPRKWRPVEVRAVTGPDGRARASVGVAAKATVRARAGAWAGWLELEEVPALSPVTLVLDREPTRPARVANPDGLPVEGALVWRIWGPLGRTDAGGRIDVPTTAPGSQHRLYVASDDGRSAAVHLRPGGEASEVPLDLTLQPLVEVKGRVVERETRRPVHGALVWPAAEVGRAVRSDPDGAFHLEAPSASVSAGLRAAAPGYRFVQRPLPIDDRTGPDDVVLELEPSAWLQGRVVDARGEPLAGARVGAILSSTTRTGHEPPIPAVWTGPDGAFLLEGLDPAHPYQVGAAKEGHATAVAELPPSPRGNDGRPVPPPAMRLVLDDSRSLTGRVLDERGQPVRDARVTLISKEQIGDPNLWVSIPDFTEATDSTGRFAFENPLPVDSIFAVLAPGHAPLFRYEQPISPGSSVTDLGDLELDPEARVRGRIVDQEGRPVEGVEVREKIASAPSFLRDLLSRYRKTGPATVTGTDGSFVLGSFIAGEPLQLEAVKEGFAPGEVWAQASRDGEPVEIELRGVARISGHVTDASGRPVRATVSPADSHHDGGRFHWVATDEEGKFVIADAPPGHVVLEAESPGHARSDPLALDLTPGEHRDGVELVLREGLVLNGRILETGGRPVTGAQVWAALGSRVATSDAEG